MRKAINENPLVQIAVLGVMGLVVAVVFLMQMGGGEEAAPPPVAPTNAPSGQTPADRAPGAPAPSEPAATKDSTPSAGTPDPAKAESGLEASAGLPASFVRAYDERKPIAIFVVRDKPESDKTVAGYAKRLRGDGGASVFVIHPRQLGDWVRAVGPVGVDRTPALVVVEPAGEGGEPLASVSYGFRNYESVAQAITDARYDGPVRGYDPD